MRSLGTFRRAGRGPRVHAQGSDGLDTISNPVTGEVVTFLERGPERCVFEVVIPPNRVPVITHRHPGTEAFEVLSGCLRLIVDDTVRDLDAGERAEVTGTQFHAPTNATLMPVRVKVTCAPYGHFAERGMRMAFGMAADGRIRPDGTPRDLLTLALGSEGGRFQIAGPPTFIWRPLMVMLSAVAVVAGRRKVLESYWPDDLPRPWGR